MTWTTDEPTGTREQAAGEARHVAGVAQDEARHVADDVKQQARGLFDDALSQVDQQSHVQRDRLVGTLQSFSDDLEQMASSGGRSGLATDVARQVASRTRDWSRQLEGREPTELLDEVRSFARRRPGMFLFGAVAAGVVAGRLARGAKDAHAQDGQAQTLPVQRTAPGPVPATDAGLGTPPPPVPPVEPGVPDYASSTPGYQTSPRTPGEPTTGGGGL